MLRYLILFASLFTFSSLMSQIGAGIMHYDQMVDSKFRDAGSGGYLKYRLVSDSILSGQLQASYVSKDLNQINLDFTGGVQLSESSKSKLYFGLGPSIQHIPQQKIDVAGIEELEVESSTEIGGILVLNLTILKVVDLGFRYETLFDSNFDSFSFTAGFLLDK